MKSKSLPSEEVIIRFYLGHATEEEEIEIAIAVLEDDFYEEMGIVETDLIRNYLCGYLDESEKKIFEDNYLTTPERIKNVAFMTAFLEKIEREKRTEKGAG